MIWEGELLGQFSDGMWENAAPLDHWRFWADLRVCVDPASPPQVAMDAGYTLPWRQKTGYNIAALYPIIGDRMLSLGRMGKALEASGLGLDLEASGGPLRSACEYMGQMTFQDWREQKASGKWAQPWIAEYMKAVSIDLAEAFYATQYAMKDMKKDVAAIKAAMKTVRNR